MDDIIPQEETHKDKPTAKYVKLKFTQRQFETFQNACDVLSVVSDHEDFYKIVKEALESNDLRKEKILSQMVTPIISAPLKNMVKPAQKKQDEEAKTTHFTKSITANKACRVLYEKLHPVVQASYKNMEEGTTTITEIRTMVNKYVAANDLKTEEGIVVDDFLKSIAPATFQENEESLHYDGSTMIIPKGNRNILYKVAEEISKST